MGFLKNVRGYQQQEEEEQQQQQGQL